MSFRLWLEQLRSTRGHRPLWPVLLGAALDAEFQRQKESSACYAGEVFIDRDSHALEDGEREERLVARLYRSALDGDGCIALDQQRVWLLGFQWPTQGGVREKKRQADLVGMAPDGGIVVFEAKRSDGDPPLVAIAEGLDYLACLLRPNNFAKITAGFRKKWTGSQLPVPLGFESVVPNREVRPQLVVLAPEAYFFGRQSRSIRGRDWPYLAAAGETMIPSVRLVFAATDFKSPILWVPSRTGQSNT